MTNHEKILKLLKTEIQEVIDDQPDLDLVDAVEGVLDGLRQDILDMLDAPDDEDEDGDIDEEGLID
jgi:hypothetical protein